MCSSLHELATCKVNVKQELLQKEIFVNHNFALLAIFCTAASMHYVQQKIRLFPCTLSYPSYIHLISFKI